LCARKEEIWHAKWKVVGPCSSPAKLACVFITVASAVISIIYVRNRKGIELGVCGNCSVVVSIQFGLTRLDAPMPMSL